MVLDVSEASRRFEPGQGEQMLPNTERGEENKLTKQELMQMSLESLLYYVLVGEGRRSL